MHPSRTPASTPLAAAGRVLGFQLLIVFSMTVFTLLGQSQGAAWTGYLVAMLAGYGAIASAYQPWLKALQTCTVLVTAVVLLPA